MTLHIESTTSSQSEQLIKEFLNTHYSATLASADLAGNPHGAVVYFKPQDDFTLLFATKSATQKYENLSENPKAAFTMFDEAAQSTLQTSGRVEIITDQEQRQAAINNLFTSSAELSLTAFPPIDKLIAGEYVVLRFVPQTIRLAVYARPEEDGDGLFETLLFSES